MKIGPVGLVIAASLAETLNVSGCPSLNAPPRFEDYLVTVYGEPPVSPHIVAYSHRRYRTRIRQGVGKGWGVYQEQEEQNKPGPNFAGDMIVIQWGCGAPCLMAAIVLVRARFSIHRSRSMERSPCRS